MDKIFFGLNILVVIMMISASDIAEKNSVTIYNNWNGLHMQVEADSVTPKGLKLSVVNESLFAFRYGMFFRIEEYSDNAWRQVPFVDGEPGWFLVGYFVLPGFTAHETINWEHMHGHLQQGNYRLIKKFTEGLRTPKIPLDTIDFYLYVPFTIN